MAYIYPGAGRPTPSGSDFQENRRWLLGQTAPGADVPLSGGGAAAPPDPGGAGLNMTSGPTVGSPQGGGIEGPSPFDLGGGRPLFDLERATREGAVAGLAAPISAELGRQGERLQGSVTEFQTAAGPSRTFESSGAVGDLERAIAPASQGDSALFDKAKGYVNADYAGPAGLNPQTVAGVREAASDAATQARALRSGGGLVNLLGLAIPGLTPGMARFEASRLMADPTYRMSAIAPVQEAEAFQGRVGAEEKKAGEFAKQRDTEEEGIRTQSRSFLDTRRDDTTRGIGERAAAANREADARRTAWEQLSASGRLEDLAAIPREALSFDPALFNTPGRQLADEAERKYWEIVSQPQYQGIIGMPALDLAISGRGVEKYSLQGDDRQIWEAVKQGYIDVPTMELLKARQRELDAAGFSPGSYKTFKAEPGKYSTVMPAYYGEPGGPTLNRYQPEEIRPFLNWKEGAPATLENMASGDERFLVNRVAELLDESGRLGESAVPFRMGMIEGDPELYQSREDEVLGLRKKALEEATKEQKETTSKARRKYKKNQRRKVFEDLARVGAGTHTFGLSELHRALPPLRPFAQKYEGMGGGMAAGIFG